MKIRKHTDNFNYFLENGQYYFAVSGWCYEGESRSLPELNVYVNDHLTDDFELTTFDRDDITIAKGKIGYRIVIPASDEIRSIKVMAVKEQERPLYVFLADDSKINRAINRSTSIKAQIDTQQAFCIKDYNVVSFIGWGYDALTYDPLLFNVYIDQQLVDSVIIQAKKRTDVIKRIHMPNMDPMCGFKVDVGFEQQDFERIYLVATRTDGKKETIATMSKREFQQHLQRQDKLTVHFDAIVLEDTNEGETVAILKGWLVSSSPDDKTTIRVVDQQQKPVAATIQFNERDDLADTHLVTRIDTYKGFYIRVNLAKEQTLDLIFENETKVIKQPLSVQTLNKLMKQLEQRGKVAHVRSLLTRQNALKAYQHMKIHGLAQTLRTAYKVLRFGTIGIDYAKWYNEHQASEEELASQRETSFAYQPKISIVVPTYKTPEVYLREMIDSVINQTYSNWELCIADGSVDDEQVLRILTEYAQKDDRVRFTVLAENYGISGNTNAALELATGEYVALFDHDDTLPPNSLFEIVAALQTKAYDVVYTDEDKINSKGTTHSAPHFKPDFSLDLLRSVNYITHFFVVKRAIIEQVGGFRSEFDGAQDYDFILRCVEAAQEVHHIAKILYHWRIHENSVAGNPSSKLYAYTAGQRAIEAHYERLGVEASVEQQGFISYRTIYKIKDQPKVSIIIPSKDHIEDLEKCITSIQKKSTYRQIEFVIVENNSTEPETFAYYDKLQSMYDNVKVVTWTEGFNYSAINNFGAQHATGEYLLLLNNDTEMKNPDAIEDMLGYCMQSGVGAVGAKLFYEDETIQHAGVIVGAGGAAGHAFLGLKDKEFGYMAHTNMSCNYSAVTAACLMTPKAVFNHVNGLTEEFVVAYNDIDYCLKVVTSGYRIVYDAYSKWSHYESKSRGYENTPEKQARLQKERMLLRTTWREFFAKGDPMYNENFSLMHLFTLQEDDIWRKDQKKMQEDPTYIGE